MDVDSLRDYLHRIKDDWNYITPIDFYNDYYIRPMGISNRHFLSRRRRKCAEI